MPVSQMPLVQTSSREVNQLQQNIAQVLNPLAANTVLSGSLISSVALAIGSNTINHGLNKQLQGWILVRVRASATIFDTQDSNPTPDKTLQLTTDNAVTVDLYVY